MSKEATQVLVAEQEIPALLQSRKVTAIDLVMSRFWAIQPDMLETIVAIAQRENATPELISEKLGRPLLNTRKVTMRDGVAIVPLNGPMFRRANLFSEISGATSTEQFLTDLRTAADNQDVKAIVLDIDSQGGDATSIAETADRIREISKIKPVIAYIDGTGASAAYWLAAAATKIVASKTAVIGSIGAVMSVRRGKDPNYIEFVSSQSPYKRLDPEKKEGRDKMQQMLDSFAQVFIESVAQLLGISVETILSDFGQGGVMVGAEALKAGMVHEIGSLESIIAGLSGKKLESEDNVMSEEKKDKPAITRTYLNENHPDLVKAIREEGFVEGTAKGAENERNRIKSVEEQSIAGHEKLIQEMKFDGKTSGPEAAVRVLNAERSARDTGLKDRKADSPAALKPSSDQPGEKTGAEKFDAMVTEKMDGGKLSRGKAIMAVARDNPELHQEWLDKQQKPAKS